jgi:hypothetical protein
MPKVSVLEGPRSLRLTRMKTANKTVQATPMNAAVLPLRSRAGLCHRYGVPDLFRSAQDRAVI